MSAHYLSPLSAQQQNEFEWSFTGGPMMVWLYKLNGEVKPVFHRTAQNMDG